MRNSLQVMKKSFLTHVGMGFCCTLLLAACQHGEERKQTNLPPLAPSEENDKIRVVTTLVKVPTQTSADAVGPESMPALLSGPLFAIGKEGLKWLAKQGGDAMNKYAENFGKTYSAKVIAADYSRSTANLVVRAFVFKRTVVYPNKSLALRDFANETLEPGTWREKPDGSVEVDAVVVPIVLLSCGFKNESWRFIAPTDDLVAKHLLDDMPKNVIYQARAARVLGWDKVEKYTVAVAATVRHASSSELGVSVFTSSPAEFSIKGKDWTNDEGARIQVIKGKALSSDWMPAPTSEAYSLECVVVESSRMKEWITKTSKKLVEQADKKIDELEWK